MKREEPGWRTNSAALRRNASLAEVRRPFRLIRVQRIEYLWIFRLNQPFQHGALGDLVVPGQPRQRGTGTAPGIQAPFAELVLPGKRAALAIGFLPLCAAFNRLLNWLLNQCFHGLLLVVVRECAPAASDGWRRESRAIYQSKRGCRPAWWPGSHAPAWPE